MGPEEKKVLFRAAIAVLVLIVCVELLTFYTETLDDLRCTFYSDEFAEERHQNLVAFTNAPFDEKKLSYCSNLLATWGLHPRIVAELRQGKFNGTPLQGPLTIVCETLEDSRFLLENLQCTRKFKVRPWEQEAMQTIDLFNIVLPLWFKCSDNSYAEDQCASIAPYLSRFQKLTQKF